MLVLGEEYFIGKMGGKEAGPARKLEVVSLPQGLYFAIMVHASLSRVHSRMRYRKLDYRWWWWEAETEREQMNKYRRSKRPQE